MAEWNAPLPPNDVIAGTPGHPEMHNELVDAITEVRGVVDDVETAANTAPTWASVTGKPSVIAAGADAAAARTAIGAGTSSLTLGTTSSTAKAGDYQPTWAQVSGKPTEFAPADHTHDAADVASGTLALARIPTGTAGTQVALGDHTHTGLLAGTASAVADSEATDVAGLVTDLNALLAVLRTRGVLST